ncbi:MAG: hypothetical protein L7G96_07015 [Vulcanisaeta sp.]|nr:hypothetical protein [Vulcanisaeta sp.]
MAEGVPMMWFVLITLIIAYAILGYAINLAENASYIAEEGIFGTLGPGAYNNFTAPIINGMQNSWTYYGETTLILIGIILIFALIMQLATSLRRRAQEWED